MERRRPSINLNFQNVLNFWPGGIIHPRMQLCFQLQNKSDTISESSRNTSILEEKTKHTKEMTKATNFLINVINFCVLISWPVIHGAHSQSLRIILDPGRLACVAHCALFWLNMLDDEIELNSFSMICTVMECPGSTKRIRYCL